MKHLPAILILSLLTAGCGGREDAAERIEPPQPQSVANPEQVPPVASEQPAGNSRPTAQGNSLSRDRQATSGQANTPSRDEQRTADKTNTPSRDEQAAARKTNTPSRDEQLGKKSPPAVASGGWRPPTASSPYWRPPIIVTFPELPEVPEEVLGPSPKIDEQ